MMDNAVSHYSLCNSVKHVYIIWSEKDPPPERFRYLLTAPIISFKYRKDLALGLKTPYHTQKTQKYNKLLLSAISLVPSILPGRTHLLPFLYKMRTLLIAALNPFTMCPILTAYLQLTMTCGCLALI